MIPKRHKEILKLTYERTWVTINDILPIIPNIKYARRVMSKLISQKCIQCVRCPIFTGAATGINTGTTGPGINFYTLDKQGYRELFTTTYGYKNHKNVTGTNLLHYYITNSFLTGFKVLSMKYPELRVTYITDRQVRNENKFLQYFIHIEKKHNIKIAYPDFILCLGDNKDKELYFGEVDTSTEVISGNNNQAKTIQNKFKTFIYIKENDIFKFFDKHFEYDFDDFTYLHITTGNEARIANIILNCQLSNVLITTANKIFPKNNYDNLLAPIWYSVQKDNFQNIFGGVKC